MIDHQGALLCKDYKTFTQVHISMEQEFIKENISSSTQLSMCIILIFSRRTGLRTPQCDRRCFYEQSLYCQLSHYVFETKNNLDSSLCQTSQQIEVSTHSDLCSLNKGFLLSSVSLFVCFFKLQHLSQVLHLLCGVSLHF